MLQRAGQSSTRHVVERPTTIKLRLLAAAAAMSRTPLAYRPNPDGWIDTSSTAKSRPSTQRPLTALRHNLGIATPPSSTFRHPRGKPKDETPLARQSNLVAYMTPPTTGSGKFAARPRGMQKVMNDVERELVTPSATATGRAAIKEKKMKDFWMLDAEPGPSQPRSTPSAKRPLRQRDENAQVDDGTSDGIISPRGKRIRKMDHIASQPIRSSRLSALRLRSPDGVSDGDEVEEDHRDGAQRHPPLDATPERISQLGSDLPERTPVPSSVLAMHKRLCHQNSSGTRRIRSPWRPHGDSSPIQPKRERVKTGPEKREEVDARAKAIRNKENRKRELAVLSDEEETLDQRSANASEVRRGGAWETLQPNMDRKRPLQTQKRFVTGFASPRNRLRPASSTSDVPSDDARLDRSRHSRARSVQHEPHRHLRSVPGKARSPNLEGPNDRSSGSSSENALSSPLHRRARQRSSSLRLVSPIQEFARAQTPRASEVEQPPTTSPTRVITPDDRFDHTTPRKHRAPTSRHHITPKKSLSPKIMQTMNETLFAFSPPPQPRFSPPVQKVQKAWQPVSMDAETLITWAPAGWAETMEQMEQGRAHAEDADEALVDPGRREAMDAVEQLGKNGSAEVVRPHPTPLQERAYTRSGSSSSETESVSEACVGGGCQLTAARSLRNVPVVPTFRAFLALEAITLEPFGKNVAGRRRRVGGGTRDCWRERRGQAGAAQATIHLDDAETATRHPSREESGGALGQAA